MDIDEGGIICFRGNYCNEDYLVEQKAIIKWDEDARCCYLDVNNEDIILGINCHHDDGFKVIGNIYENPEMIK